MMESDVLEDRSGEPTRKSFRSQLSAMSLDSGILYNQDPKFQLHLLQKKQTKPSRSIIPATKFQRLSYYRTYTATSFKTDISSKMNSFSWAYLFHTILQSLPQTFIHIFLASYAPKQHLFLSKMVPIAYGTKFLSVITALFQLLIHIDLMICFLHYFIVGIYDKNPWNRCDSAVSFDAERNITIHCYNISKFVDKNMNNAVKYSDFAYISENETFLVAQIDYYRKHGFQKKEYYIRNSVYFFIVWTLILALEYQVIKKHFWKMLNWSQWFINVADLITYIYLLWVKKYMEKKPFRYINATYINVDHEKTFRPQIFDLLIRDSITAPPVVHVLTARSTQPIYPGQDSSVIIISNAALYLFKGILNSSMKEFCEYHVLRTQIEFHDFDVHDFFYLWPMFYATFYLGNIYCVLFFGLNFVSLVLTATVTYRCLSETIMYEWRLHKLKRWKCTVIFIVCGFLIFFLTNPKNRVIFSVFCNVFSTFTEIFFIFLVYPLGRLVDDFSFHYGHPMANLRILTLRLVPLYYFLIKILDTVSYLKISIRTQTPYYQWSYVLLLVPSLLGTVYITYTYVIRYKMPWTHLFRPVQNWGPTDFSLRQLRKQFESKSYIRSEAPKFLSRYFQEKKASNVYKLDVRYDFTKKSTPNTMEVRFQDEKKKKK